MLPTRTLLMLGAVALAACSAAARGGAPASSRRVLRADEIRSVVAADAYEAVARLRPEWLQRRAQTSIRDPTADDVVIYLDGVRFGGPESLRNIQVETIVQIELLDVGEATMRYGMDHTGGAILVKTR